MRFISYLCLKCCLYLLFFEHGNIGKHSLEGPPIVSISIRVCLIMNHGTIVQQNCRRSASDKFHHFCLRLFNYEPWNHIPPVREGSTCDNYLCF